MLHCRVWLVLVLVALQGCAARAPDSCRVNDWYATGYQDGLTGRAEAAPGGLQACPRGPDGSGLADYRKGREAGLARYCEPHNGFRLGSQGESYQSVCGDQAREFLQAYQQGRQMHEVETQIGRLDAILRVNEAERQSLAQRLRQKRLALVRASNDALVQAELAELEETLAVVDAEIEALTAALEEQQTRHALLRQAAGFR